MSFVTPFAIYFPNLKIIFWIAILVLREVNFNGSLLICSDVMG